jgi:hypothetical protein
MQADPRYKGNKHFETEYFPLSSYQIEDSGLTGIENLGGIGLRSFAIKSARIYGSFRDQHLRLRRPGRGGPVSGKMR